MLKKKYLLIVFSIIMITSCSNDDKGSNIFYSSIDNQNIYYSEFGDDVLKGLSLERQPVEFLLK